MAKLNYDWFDGFGGLFEEEEDVVEFIFERLNTDDFEDGYVTVGNGGEPNEMIKQTAEDKRELLYNFMMWLVNDKKD